MSDSSDNPSADFRDQVEARLVAMMLGEASAFDEEQIRELLKKDSELAKFHAEMNDPIFRLHYNYILVCVGLCAFNVSRHHPIGRMPWRGRGHM